MNDATGDRLLAYSAGPVGHRKQVYGVDQFDDMGEARLDELVLTHVDTVHLEHLSHNSAYLGIYGPDGRTVQFNISTSKGGDLHVSLAWTDFGDEEGPSEDEEYLQKVREGVAAHLADGQKIGVFDRIDCAVCIDCDQILMALPKGVPPPDFAVFDHVCAEEPADG